MGVRKRFRNSAAAAAKRKEKQTKSTEEKRRHIVAQMWAGLCSFGGQGASSLAFSWGFHRGDSLSEREYPHYIRAVVLEQLVLQNLQRVIAYVQEDESEFVRLVMKNQSAAQAAEQEQAKRLLEKNTRRVDELDAIIQRLYEDNVSGKLSDERFKKLSDAYEQEQAALRESIPALTEQVRERDSRTVDLQHFLKQVRRYTQPEKLTPAMLRELVEKVVVYAPDKSSGHRTRRIDVYYTFIGKIDFSPEYSKKGTA